MYKYIYIYMYLYMLILGGRSVEPLLWGVGCGVSIAKRWAVGSAPKRQHIGRNLQKKIAFCCVLVRWNIFEIYLILFVWKRLNEPMSGRHSMTELQISFDVGSYFLRTKILCKLNQVWYRNGLYEMFINIWGHGH